MKEETCEHCGNKINVNEQACVYRGMVICSKCDKTFRNTKIEGTKRWRIIFISIMFCITFILLFCFLYSKYVRNPETKIEVFENILWNRTSFNDPNINRMIIPSVAVSPNGNRVAVFEPNCVFVDGQKYGWKVASRTSPSASTNFLFSANNESFAFVAESENEQFVVFNGNPQILHAAPTINNLTLSPNGKRIAYVTVSNNKGGSNNNVNRIYRLIVDGEVKYETDMRIGEIVFSPDSKFMAYLLYRIDTRTFQISKYIVALGDMKSQEYDNVYELQFLPAGNQLVYMAHQSGKYFMVINEKRGPVYDGIGKGDPVISPDGTKYAYVAKKGQKTVMVINGVESELFDGLGRALFSPDSQSVMFSALRNDRHYVVIDGVVGPGYDAVGALMYSPDSKRTAYFVKQGDKHKVVVDRLIQEEEFDSLHYMTFSPDSKKLAYLVKHNEETFLVVDGIRKEGRYDSATLLTFSPDNKRIAFCANVDKKSVTLNEEDYEIHRIPNITGNDSSGFPKIEYKEVKSPNKQGMEKLDRAAGNLLVVIDGVQEQKYHVISNFTFSPDSKHYVYWAMKDSQWALVINGKEFQTYQGLISHYDPESFDYTSEPILAGRFISHPNSKIHFDTKTKFHTLAIKDNKVIRIDVDLEAGNADNNIDVPLISSNELKTNSDVNTPFIDANSPVVIVNGVAYTNKDVNNRTQLLKSYIKSRIDFYPSSYLHNRKDELIYLFEIINDSNSYPESFILEREKEFRRIAIDSLIVDQLLDMEINKNEIVLSQESFNTKLGQNMSGMNIDSITQQLLKQGNDPNKIINVLYKAVCNEVLFERQWEGKININQEEIESYYLENRQEFVIQEQVQRFSEVADLIKETLTKQSKTAITMEYINSLMAAADIEYKE